MGDYIKKNISNLKPSATLAINEKVKKLLKDGKKVFNFGFGQSPFPIPDKIVEVLKENAHKKDYLPTDERHEDGNIRYEWQNAEILLSETGKPVVLETKRG